MKIGKLMRSVRLAEKYDNTVAEILLNLKSDMVMRVEEKV